jgi:hypothetical protein
MHCTTDGCDGAGSCAGTPRPAGTPCDADGSVCTPDTCDATGACASAPRLSCAICQRCDAALGCVTAPAPSCRVAPRTLLVLRDRFGTDSDQLTWRWSGGEAPAAEFGDPRSSEGYSACLFALSTPDPGRLLGIRVQPGGACPAGSMRPCWRASGQPPRFTYRDQQAGSSGVHRLVLRPGAAGDGAILIRARGEQIALPPPPLDPPLLFQLQADNGACWEAHYDGAALRANGPGLLKATSAAGD